MSKKYALFLNLSMFLHDEKPAGNDSVEVHEKIE